MAFHYFYSSIDINTEQEARRPVVPININGYGFTGLVDSGSDAIVVPIEIAEVLDIKIKDKAEIGMLDGTKVGCGVGVVDLEFGKRHESHKFSCKVLIAKSPKGVILGRNCFFENFKICFEEDKEIVSFKKINPLRKIYRKF